MPDSRDALLQDCIQTARELETACPQAQQLTARLVGYLDLLGGVIKLTSTPLPPRESYAHFRSLYEASVAFLKRRPSEEVTEQKLIEGLIAGNAFQSELPGFQRRLRQALNNRKRTDIERISRGEDPAYDILRLRETSRITLKKR